MWAGLFVYQLSKELFRNYHRSRSLRRRLVTSLTHSKTSTWFNALFLAGLFRSQMTSDLREILRCTLLRSLFLICFPPIRRSFALPRWRLLREGTTFKPNNPLPSKEKQPTSPLKPYSENHTQLAYSTTVNSISVLTARDVNPLMHSHH